MFFQLSVFVVGCALPAGQIIPSDSLNVDQLNSTVERTVGYCTEYKAVMSTTATTNKAILVMFSSLR